MDHRSIFKRNKKRYFHRNGHHLFYKNLWVNVPVFHFNTLGRRNYFFLCCKLPYACWSFSKWKGETEKKLQSLILQRETVLFGIITEKRKKANFLYRAHKLRERNWILQKERSISEFYSSHHYFVFSLIHFYFSS